MLKKRISRLYAVQILYQLHYVNVCPKLAVDNFLKNYQNELLLKPDYDLVILLVMSSFSNENEVKNIVEPYLSNHAWENLELIISLILRVAISEIKNFPDLDMKVIISEYMTIASTFFENNKISIINPILEQVAKEIRSGNKRNK